MKQHVFQLTDAGIEFALLVFGLVVLAVLAQVTESPSHLDHLRNLVAAGGFQIVQLFLQLVKPGLTHLEFFFHVTRSFPSSVQAAAA